MAIVRRKTDLVAQLHMSKLNDSRKLLAKASVLEDHKQLILAIASGRVERVAPLVQAALKNRAGIGTIIQQYE
jgi:DNA-binding FadR family transcriptional regulator